MTMAEDAINAIYFASRRVQAKAEANAARECGSSSIHGTGSLPMSWDHGVTRLCVAVPCGWKAATATGDCSHAACGNLSFAGD